MPAFFLFAGGARRGGLPKWQGGGFAWVHQTPCMVGLYALQNTAKRIRGAAKTTVVAGAVCGGADWRW